MEAFCIGLLVLMGCWMLFLVIVDEASRLAMLLVAALFLLAYPVGAFILWLERIVRHAN